MARVRRVLLIEPFAGARWRSITAYADSLREMLVLAGVEVQSAEAPWFNPPSLAEGLRRRWWRQPTVVAAQEGAYDLVHIVDHGLAQHASRFRDAVPVVTTCHDVMPFTVPGYYATAREAALKRAFLRRSYRALGQSDAVIAVSHFTAGELQQTFSPGVPIAVVPNIVRPAFTVVADEGTDPSRRGVLSVGNDRAYKNLSALVRALARPSLAHVPLVRVGPRLDGETQRLAEELGVARRIEYRTAEGDAGLAGVYRECAVLAQPSLAEGFGIPVIEAMASGLPVVVSDGGAIPEVVADAGIVVPLGAPDFPGVLAAALNRAIGDDGELARRGRERARLFEPPAVLPALLEAYEQAFDRQTA
ncbi:MAG: glycosyltransferase family 4 protein [Dehalococcoidia bacterium]|nr:glycosyltransferase family 4 protein [Dehalococcoidia bacterium]